jgi:hypothetical protein
MAHNKMANMNRLFLLLLLLLLGLSGYSQNYPITVSASLAPPYSLRLSDYGAVGSQRLVVTVQVHDLGVVNLPVKLRLRMETSGITIETPVSLAVPPVYLNGGQVQLFFGEDLAAYFNPGSLVWRGYSLAQYHRAGQLPEGFYRFTVEVLHHHTGRVISNAAAAAAWMALGKPPVLKDPLPNAELGQVAGMPLLFSWHNAQVGIPQGSVQYLLQLWELRVPGVDPHVVAATQPPFYTHAPQAASTLAVQPAALLLEPGGRYAWRVTASDAMGMIPFEQNGQSELRTFTYLSKCDSVKNLTLTLDRSRRATLSWTPAPRHLMYEVEVENPATGWRSAASTFDTRVQYFDLAAGSSYRLRVQPTCNDPLQTTGSFTAWRTLSVPPPKPPDTATCPSCGCGDPAALPALSNLEPKTDLKAGDTLTDRRGTTRYIVKTAEEVRTGVYRGVFLFWAEIWGIKIVCQYEELTANTDNVILRMSYESVYDPQYLLDVDEAADYINAVADAAAELTTNKTVRDTLKYKGAIESVYTKNDTTYIVTKNPDGTLTETLLQPDQKLNATLVQGENGEAFVVAPSGAVMGVEEFQKTGGSNRQVEQLKREKEATQTAPLPTVQFTATANQKYGFDAYEDKSRQSLQNDYPELKAGYRPAYKSVASFATDKVQVANGTAATTYRDEMGIPAVKTTDTELTVRGQSAGTETALYAYQKADSTEQIVGKLNLLSYDEQRKKVYLVSVNNAQLPNEKTLQNELNKIYAPAITKWEVANGKSITVSFPNSQMTHGGSSLIDVYNADQKAVIKAFGALEKNALYLFFVENVKGKDGDVAGYMPLQYQCGFLYENPNASIVAHELGHGAFSLRHTFDNANFIAQQSSTNNLMDYKGGTELWKHQWGAIQEPQGDWFSFLQDEEDAELATDGHYHTMRLLALLLDIDEKTVEKLAEYAENPDSKVFSSAEMQERYTWAEPELQQQYHVLTGRTHGVELALTTYALKQAYASGDEEAKSYLWHRFGDCFGHIKLASTNIEFKNVPLTNYWKAVEDFMNAINIVVTNPIDITVGFDPTVGNVVKNLEDMQIYYDAKQNCVYTTLTKEAAQKEILRQLLISYASDLEVSNSHYKWIRVTAVEEINKRLPNNAPQNACEMYGRAGLTLEHNSPDGSMPDDIGRRIHVYINYIQKLVEMLSQFYKISGNAEQVIAYMRPILEFADEYARSAGAESEVAQRLDGILAFQYELAKKPNANRWTFSIPLKFNEKEMKAWDWCVSFLKAIIVDQQSNQKIFETDALLQKNILEAYISYLNKKSNTHHYLSLLCTQSDKSISIVISKIP